MVIQDISSIVGDPTAGGVDRAGNREWLEQLASFAIAFGIGHRTLIIGITRLS